MRTWQRLLSFILVFAILFSFPAPALADRVSDLQQELSSISNELIQINGEYASISERASQLLQEVSRLTTMMSALGADLQSISRRLSEIQTEVSGLNARKTTLDSRKSYLAGRVGEIKNEITALQSVPPPPAVTPPPPPVVPPVVNPPPVISPPPIVTPPPVTNPPSVVPPVSQTNVSGEITNTVFPTTMASGNPAAFRMDFKNTGNTGWTFIAAMTVRHPDGHDVDYGRIPSYVAAGSNGAATWSLLLPPGNYRVIFGLWRDDSFAFARSYWMDFTVSAPPVVSPPPVVTPPPVIPPVVNPPVITPPVVNPSPVITPSTNPRITATSIPSVVTVGDGFVFRMYFSGIPSDGFYEAAATIRPVGRQNEDWEKIPLRETAGMVQWYRTFHVTGDFEIIFGIWRDGIPIDRTEWMPLKSLTEEQVFGPSPTARPTVVDAPAIPTSITSPPTEKPVVKEDPIISAEITETRLDLGDWPAFTMSFKNTGNIRHDFFAAMTIKLPDGSVINYGRKEVSLDPGISGKAAWHPLFFPGKYQVIFGIWRDDGIPVTRSPWMDFTAGQAVAPIMPFKYAKILKVEILGDYSSRETLESGEKVTFRMVIKNTGNVTGTFRGCVGPCDMTSIYGLPTKYITLRPGETGWFDWQYVAKDPGDLRIPFFISGDDGKYIMTQALNFSVYRDEEVEEDDYGLGEDPEEDSFFTKLDEVLLAADLLAVANPFPPGLDEGVITSGIVVKKSFDGLYRAYEGSKILRFVWKVGGRAWDISDEAWSGYLKVERKIKYVAPSFKAGLKGQKYVTEKIGLHNLTAVEWKIGRRWIDAVAGKIFDFAGKHFNPGDLIEIKSYETVGRLKWELRGKKLKAQLGDYLDYLEPGKKLVVIFKNRMPQKDVDDLLEFFSDIRLEVINGLD